LERLAKAQFFQTDEDPKMFLLGLRDVIAGHGGMPHIAEVVGVNRESLYKAVSEKGTPKSNSKLSFPSFCTVLCACNFKHLHYAIDIRMPMAYILMNANPIRGMGVFYKETGSHSHRRGAFETSR
jgi:DNA-binding phage protein